MSLDKLSPTADVPGRAETPFPLAIPRRPQLFPIALFVFVLIGYVVMGKIGVALYTPPDDLAYFCLMNAFVVAVLLHHPRKYWPTIAAAAAVAEIIVDLSWGATWLPTLGWAFANVFEAVCIAWFMSRTLDAKVGFVNVRQVISFVLVAAAASALSGFPGAMALVGGGLSSNFATAYKIWWIGDTLSMIVVGPAFIALGGLASVSWRGKPALWWLELLSLAMLVPVVGYWILGSRLGLHVVATVMPYALFPLFIWAAIRFGAGATAWVSVGVAAIAFSELSAGSGPFAAIKGTIFDQTHAAHAFLAIVTITSLILAAAYKSLQRAQSALRESRSFLASVTDNIPAAVGYLDGKRQLIFSNKLYEAWSGHPGAALPNGVPAAGEATGNSEQPGLGKVLTGEPVKVERTVTLSGQQKMVEARYVPHFDEARGVVGYFVLGVDVTEHRRAQAELAQSLDEKVVLLKEVHHRVKNKLQIVSSLLELQAEQTSEPRLREQLRQAQQRVHAMALMHGLLHERDGYARVHLGDYLRGLGEMMSRGMDQKLKHINVNVTRAPLYLDVQRAVPFGLVVNELTMNAIKHAFPGDREGSVHISLEAYDSGRAHLTIEDTGVGLPEGYDVSQASTLGHQLVSILTQQMEATLVVSTAKGARFDFEFACDSA